MPEQITQFNVFLSSPNDLKIERELACQAIKHLNDLVKQKNIYIRLLQWEDAVSPDFGKDSVQSVINAQIGDN